MIGQSDGKSFAYLLGVCLGDGCVTNVPSNGGRQRYLRFRLNTIDRDFADATASAVESLVGKRHPVHGPYTDKRYPKAAPHWEFCCTSVALCERLVAETQAKARIPEWVFSSDKDQRLAFIAGLMDSEGFVAENRQNPTNRRYFMGFKSCDGWVLDFVRLLELTGIRVGKVRTEQPRKEHYKVPTVFNIKMHSWCDAGAYFKCSRKQKRVETWAEYGPYEQRARHPRKAKTSPNEHTSGTPLAW